MKKSVTHEVAICDRCEKEDASYTCLKCGKDYCWKCQSETGVKYSVGVFHGGSGDGFYCHPCNTALQVRGDSQLLKTYRAVYILRTEHDAWAETFNRRKIEAENHLKTLLGQGL